MDDEVTFGFVLAACSQLAGDRINAGNPHSGTQSFLVALILLTENPEAMMTLGRMARESDHDPVVPRLAREGAAMLDLLLKMYHRFETTGAFPDVDDAVDEDHA